MKLSLVDKHCKGCSHPLICDKCGCAALEAERNLAKPKVRGVARGESHRVGGTDVLVVYFDRDVSDDYMRRFHYYIGRMS